MRVKSCFLIVIMMAITCSLIIFFIATIILHAPSSFDSPLEPGGKPSAPIVAQVEPWEKYYEEANEAIEKQHFDLAEKYTILLREEVMKNTGKDGAGNYELSRIYDNQGKYDKAIDAEKIFFQISIKSLALHQIFWHYQFLAEVNQAQGKFEEARQSIEWLIQNRDRGLREAEAKKNVADVVNARSNKYWIAYPTIGDYYIQLGEYEKGIQYLKEHVDDCIRIRDISQNTAKAKNRLGLGYYYAGDEAAADTLFREAGGLNAQGIVTFSMDLAQSLTMLARIAGHRGQTEQALKFFQSARKALHMYRSKVFKVEESDILGQLGRFQLQQGKLAESGAAYHEAIALRQATATATHPNCADAIKGLADVAAARGELTSATLQATEALRILDTALVPTHPRIAPELVALASIHLQSGHPDAAVPLFTRLETILQKPLGPWKEDFMDTTAFYAGLLKKAGMPAGAERLEQLHARQKDRR